MNMLRAHCNLPVIMVAGGAPIWWEEADGALQAFQACPGQAE